MVATASSARCCNFYPRPPRGGRRNRRIADCAPFAISIHALREEGDPTAYDCSGQRFTFLSTPSARRATAVEPTLIWLLEFLSTPSARRATSALTFPTACIGYFYPRPPRGGRLCQNLVLVLVVLISIHALREEGDLPETTTAHPAAVFLSTPSARRATVAVIRPGLLVAISIHALREEGDARVPMRP